MQTKILLLSTFSLLLLLSVSSCAAQSNTTTLNLTPTESLVLPGNLPTLGTTLAEFTTQLHATPNVESNNSNPSAYIYGPFDNNTLIVAFVDRQKSVILTDISVVDPNKQSLTLKECQQMQPIDAKHVQSKVMPEATHLETDIFIYQSVKISQQFGNSLKLATMQTQKYNQSIKIEPIKAGTVVEYLKRTTNDKRIIDCRWSIGPMPLE